MPKHFLSIVLCGLFAISAAGCTERQNIFGTRTTPYHKLAKSLTKKKSFFGLDDIPYETSVMYRSRALRQAYVEEYAARYSLSAEKRESLLKREMEGADKYDEFVVAHFSSNKEAGKLSRDPKVWKLALGGVEPESVQAMPPGSDPTTRYFYPLTNSWTANYTVRFPKQSESTGLVLELTGVVENIAFNWSAEQIGQP